MSDRAPFQALASRARGIIIGSIIALGWAVFGLGGAGPSVRYPLLVAAVALTTVLVASGIAMQRRARSMPKATAAQAAAGKRVQGWFWLNLLGEIVLMNIAVYLLPGQLRVYLIPAISAIVGLHFWPMAYFFRVRSYWWVGVAMMGGAALAAALILHNPHYAFAVVHGEAMANAAILWIALASGAAARRPSDMP